ncbi:hypothetical protein [Bacteriovorax sp. BAL6_X]|uniref:hypothetical protein n=1 Tax=Bacteriovorax sp. BAL6_X TaxID=1201290 RepID=UPI00058EE84D|nr:hypothetical protein [Bacteriovorax sp. BAL6_X]
MKLNEWTVILTNESLSIDNGYQSKAYPRYTYVNNQQYEIFKRYDDIKTFDILLNFFEESFSDYRKSYSDTFLSKILKPKVLLKYPHSLRESLLGFEEAIFSEAIETAGAREVIFEILEDQ